MQSKKLKIKKNDKKAVNINIAMSILLVVVLSFISIGYALYGQILNVNGNVTFKPQGKIAITNVELISSVNVKDGSIPTFTDNSIDFNLSFEKAEGATENNYQAIYQITIENDTFYDFSFELDNFQPTIKNSSGEVVDSTYLTTTFDGITLGEKIPAMETVTFNLIFDFNPQDDDTYTVDGNLNTDLQEEPHGSLMGSVPNGATGDLKESLNHDITQFSLTVINTFQSPREFTINISDTSHFAVVDASGNSLGSLTINGGTTETYNFYVKRVDGAVFAVDTFETGIYLSYSESQNVVCGNVTITVDAEDTEDRTPPQISNVTATINNATSSDTSDNKVGSVTLNWTGVDAESGVKKYYVIVASSSETKTYETEDSNATITITGLADDTYTFKVYGENNHGYKASNSDIAGATSAAGACSISENNKFSWHYTVAYSQSSQYMKTLSNTKVNRGYNYTTTLQTNANTSTYTYSLPNSITVTMGGASISSGTTNGRYQYSNTSGSFTVYGVTGNIQITARASRSQSGGGCTS